MPEVIVTPTSTQQVAEIMKLANFHLIPVTPREPARGFPAEQSRCMAAS
jgi:glycolate oxidase